MKNSLLRKGAAILAAVLVAGMAAGCSGGKQSAASGSGASGSGASGASSSSKPVTITVMQQNDPSHNYFSALGKDFTALHPNVKVAYIGVPYDNFDSKLQTMIASHTQPDVTTHVQLMGFMDYYSKGLITDLTPYMQQYGFDAKKDGIPDSIMSMANVEGKQWGIPLNTFTTVMLINKDLFDKARVAYPPTSYSDTSWTFDKMVDTAKKLTSGTGNNKIYGLYWAWNGGGDMQDPDYFGSTLFPADASKTGKATTNNMADAKVVSVYQRLADLTFQDKVSPTPAYVTALAGSNASDPFLSGKIAMEVEGSWGLAGVSSASFKVGVAAVPVGPNAKARAVTYTDPYFVLKGSKNPGVAFQYIAFLAQPDNQIKMVQQSGNPPSSTQALDTYYQNFKSIPEADLKNAVEGSYDYSEEDLEHMIVGSGQIHTLLSNELQPVKDGSKTAQQVCPDLAKKLQTMQQSINK